MVAGTFLHDWFGWPDGAVLTNLVATAICVAFGWRKIVKLFRSHRELHDKLDALHDHLGVGQHDDA